MAADPEASVLRVAARLGLEDPTAVRRLLAAWWAWAGSLTARGELADSDVFLAQRDAEGLLELPLDVATRAIEFELADLHGLGAARRAARAGNTRPRSEPGDSGAPSPAAPPAPSPARCAGPGTRPLATAITDARWHRRVRHALHPGRRRDRTRAGRAPRAAARRQRGAPRPRPYRAWIGILAGVGGALGALIAMRVRPTTAGALRLPAIGLAALGLFSLGLLAGASWLEWAAGVLFAVVGAGAWLRTHTSGRT